MIPDAPVAFWRFFDLISLAFIFAVVSVLMISHRKRSGSLLGSISQTVAASKRSSLAFSVVMTIFFPLYYAFLWFWVWPLTSTPIYLYLLLLVSAVFEMIFVWVPATDGNSRKIHEVSAGFVGLFMFIVALVMLHTGKISTVGSVAILVFLLVSITMLALFTIPRYRKHTFLYECIYCITFLAAMSVVAHA